MEKLLTIKQTLANDPQTAMVSSIRTLSAPETSKASFKGAKIRSRRSGSPYFLHGARKIDTAIVMFSRRMVGILRLLGVASIGEVLHAVRRDMIANVRHGAILARMSVRRKRQPTEEQ